MTAHELITELQDLGVQLWTDDGRLRFRAPQGVLTDERKSALRAHRDDIRALLDNERPAVVADQEGRFEPFPLTDVQTAYLLGRQSPFGYGGVACHGYLEVHYRRLDPAAVESAWNALIARHDMLRAVIATEQAAGYQQVLPEVPTYRIEVRDLRGALAAAEVDAIRADLGHRVYDTTRWPLFELRLSRTDDGDILHFSLDALIADWGSATILLDELDAVIAGRELPELDITFRDYLVAENQMHESSRYQRDRSYWRSRVDDLPPAPDLPRAPESDGRARFRRHRFRLPAEQWDRVCERAMANESTAGNVVLAAYASVLDRWSRQDRFSLNVTLLNRHPLHEHVDRIVGDFTSVSVLAVEPLAGRALTERARLLGTQLVADLDHRLYSGVSVLRDVARAHGRDAALLPVVFTSALGIGPGDAAATGRTLGYGISQTPQVFLDCQVNDGAGELVVDWDVRQGIFPDGLIEDMFTAFGDLLTRLATDDAAWTAAEPVALPGWQEQERAAVNDTAAPLPDGLLHQGVFEQAARTPDTVAVRTKTTSLTYGELTRRAAAVAAELSAIAGQRVAVVMDKAPEQVVAVLGALLAGCAYVPVDTIQPRLRREKLLGDIQLVLSQSWVPDVAEARKRIDIDRLAPAAELPSVPDGDPDALAYVIYTSGSTGDPKGVMISHRAALNTLHDITERFAVTGDDRVLGMANLGFDLSVYDIFGALAVGATLVLPDPARGADPSHWAELAAGFGVTIWNSVPAHLQMLTGYLRSERSSLNGLRLAMLSGDWIPVTLPDEARELIPGLSLVSLGGATEASIWSIVHPIDRVDESWRSIPYGVPLRNQGFRVLDSSSRDCPVWVPGELCIAGDGLAMGYLGDEQLTAARFVTHPVDGQRLYRTGDLGRYLPGGEIEFLGREDGQVKIRGHRIELGEVEATLLAHKAVGASAAVVSGTELLAFVEPAHRTPEPFDAPRLRTAVARYADGHVAGIDPDLVAAHVRNLRQASWLSMLHALLRRGAFTGAQSGDEVLAKARVDQRHRWLVRRWLESLADGGLLERVDDGYRVCTETSDEVVRAAWDRVGARVPEGLCTEEFVAYHLAHVERLDALLDDEESPFDLLFPEGRTDVARAVYRDDSIARYLNSAAAAVLHRIATARGDDRPLRVLELGAGTGATTASVLPLLAGFDVEYTFTDLTAFFLPEARAEFGEGSHSAGVRFGLFDLDGDPREQGHVPNSADVVLCAGMLNSTRDVAAAVRKAVELAAPGGWLVFTEPTGELPNILLTQGFMMKPADRERSHCPLLPRARWRELLAEAGAQEVLCLPEDDHAFAAHDMHLFAARVKTDRHPVTPHELGEFLADRLPGHMVPAHLQVIDAIPVTANGKIDRSTLAGWRPAATARAEQETEQGGELEQRLAAMWAQALDIPHLGLGENFYDRGADSLIMARMAGRLREDVAEAAEFAYDTLLRQMLNEPTVAALAQALRSVPPTAGATTERRGNALLVPFGGEQDGPTRVLFHAALGTMDFFQAIGGAMGAQNLGPVVGLAVADAEEYCAIPPRRLIPSVADDYTERLLEGGETRFQLVGYCLGGLLAVEVARRLAERGAEVVDLTLVDSIPMLVDTDEELAFESIFMPNLGLDPVRAVFGEDVEAADLYRAIDKLMAEHDGRVPAGALGDLDGDPGLAAVAAAARRQSGLSRQERFARYTAAAAEQADLPVDTELIPALFRVCRHSIIAARFDPEPYVGDITFLRASEQQSFGITAGVGHLAAPFWERACLGRFTVHDVPGNHFSVIEPPNVTTVAAHLAEPLDQALRKESRP